MVSKFCFLVLFAPLVVSQEATPISLCHFKTASPLSQKKEWSNDACKPRQRIKKQRHHFTNKGPYSQSYVFPVVMYGCEKSASGNHSLMSGSLQPHGLYSPWNSGGQDIGVGSHSLLQGVLDHKKRLKTEKLMLLKCGVGEDSWESWESLGLRGDPTSPS